MALAKYAEDIQEAIEERWAMREYTYDFNAASSKNATAKGGEVYDGAFPVRTH